MSARTNESVLTSKGQTTIPAKIRKALHLKAGDTLEYYVQGDVVVLQPKTVSISDLTKLLVRPEKKVSIEEMNKAISNSALKCLE
jgi:antitoxin PrlF